MEKKLGVVVAAAILLLTLTIAASAFEIDLSLSGSGNIYRMELTPAGSYFEMTGYDRVYRNSPCYGTVVCAGGKYNIGLFSHMGNSDTATDLQFSAVIDTSTLSGPYHAWRNKYGDQIAGTMTVNFVGGSPETPAHPEMGDIGVE